jgi:hypothetical protein
MAGVNDRTISFFCGEGNGNFLWKYITLNGILETLKAYSKVSHIQQRVAWLPRKED